MPLGPKAMEMVMRDVLGGMEELALIKGYDSSSNVFEILAISPVSDEDKLQNKKIIRPDNNADIIPFEANQKSLYK